ncbi:MAG: DNA methyltransferase [Candidatus Bathyarchaeota archaeon]|nr:DNA methyltransferase [Candidatus Bathyarchaeota archaeon]
MDNSIVIPLPMHALKTKEVPIAEIIGKSDFNMREELDKELVVQYKENLSIIVDENPIKIYDTPSGLILYDGFHRLAAARQLNWTEIKAIVKKGSVQDAYTAACLANLNHGKPLSREERKKAIKEYIKLKVKLSNVLIANDVGVSDETIRRYRNELLAEGDIEPQEKRRGADGKTYTKPASTNVEPEAEPEPEPDPFTEWFSEHVFCGDALKVMPTLELKFDLAIIDPPYGITAEDWDLKNKHELLTFTRRWLNQVLLLLKPTGRLYVFWSRKYMFELKPLFDEILNEYPITFGGIIVWTFTNVQSMPDSRKRLKLSWEPIFHYYGSESSDLIFDKTEITGKKWKGEEQSDSWKFAIPQSNFKDKRVHPTQKPLELYRRIIRQSTHTGESVISPFAGSGTTGHAALLEERNFCLIEKNPDYVELIEKRLRPVWKERNSENE